MRPNTAPVAASTPMMQYYSPHDVMANSYYPQVCSSASCHGCAQSHPNDAGLQMMQDFAVLSLVLLRYQQLRTPIICVCR